MPANKNIKNINSLSGYSILLVDDEVEICTSVSKIIEKKTKIKTHYVLNGHDALLHIKNNKIDLAIIDISMPQMDGLTLLKKIKESNPEIVCIILTGQADIEKVKSSFKLGAYDFLEKPVEAETLNNCIKNALSKVELKQVKKKFFEEKRLVRTLCHDLSNILNVIWTISNHMSKHGMERDMEHIIKSFKKILRAADLQLDIVKNVRTSESIKDGKSGLNLSKTVIKDLYAQAYFLFKDRLRNKNISFSYETNDENLTINVDPVSFSNNVINNLVSNAIKFSNEGEKVTFISNKNNNDEIVISIIDQGIGIPKEILDNFLDMEGTSISRTGTNGEVGTGFGMPLVKATLDQSAAELYIESRDIDKYPDDHGTTFTIVLKTPS